VHAADAAPGQFSFVQISDSHIGYAGPANADVHATLEQDGRHDQRAAGSAGVRHPHRDVTHLSKVTEFDDARAILSRLRAPLLALPGEHDVIGAQGPPRFAAAFGRRGRGRAAAGRRGIKAAIHFVALINVGEGETMGVLGPEQLAWLEKDLAARARPDTPIVVFGHVPLFAVAPEWGWTTMDGTKAIALLRPFLVRDVLNGHIHQIVEHQDGTIRFATARATAFSAGRAGTPGAKPGPLAVAPGSLLGVLGYRTVESLRRHHGKTSR